MDTAQGQLMFGLSVLGLLLVLFGFALWFRWHGQRWPRLHGWLMRYSHYAWWGVLAALWVAPLLAWGWPDPWLLARTVGVGLLAMVPRWMSAADGA